MMNHWMMSVYITESMRRLYLWVVLCEHIEQSIAQTLQLKDSGSLTVWAGRSVTGLVRRKTF